MPTPDIAVVMPVYNRQGIVGRAIHSVLAQDHVAFELVVVDDGSDDGTAAAVAAYADPRVKLVRLDRNGGGNAARNRGIRESTAPLVAFLDSDDAYLPHKLGHVVRYFAAAPQVDVLIDSFELVWPPGSRKANDRQINPVLASSAEIELALFHRRIHKPTPAISARRAALFAVGLFDESLRRRQDFELLLRLVTSARCTTTDTVLWTKYWMAGAISATKDTFVASTVDLCRRHPRYVTDPRFRVGLARDVARHLMRLGLRGRLGAAASDAACLGRAFGVRTLVGLLRDGFGELARRKIEKLGKKRARARRSGAR